MKFGHVETDQLDNIDLTLPENAPENIGVLGGKKAKKSQVYVGCAKWGRDEWVGVIYPEETKSKDFLSNYVNHFNSIELNATFYNARKSNVEKWATVPHGDFKFCPKFPRRISHIKRLKESEESTGWFFNTVSAFNDTLGLPFLQMPDNFAPKYFDRLRLYIESAPREIPFALELRHIDWFEDNKVFWDLGKLLEDNNVTLVIMDSAGRRDCIHQRLTTKSIFIRFVGYDLHPTDNLRMDEWAMKINDWINAGLENVYFFLHQEDEKNTIFSADYMIHKLNEVCNLQLKAPAFLEKG